VDTKLMKKFNSIEDRTHSSGIGPNRGRLIYKKTQTETDSKFLSSIPLV